MEIILKTDIPKLGYRGDIVEVKPGYARNFLIPKGKAMVANDSNRRNNAEILRQQANKLSRRKDEAQEVANRLGQEEIEVKVKSGSSGKIFGSVTNVQIAGMLNDKGYAIDRRNISFTEPIKETGTHTAYIECYKDIVAEVSIVVKAEK